MLVLCIPSDCERHCAEYQPFFPRYVVLEVRGSSRDIAQLLGICDQRSRLLPLSVVHLVNFITARVAKENTSHSILLKRTGNFYLRTMSELIEGYTDAYIIKIKEKGLSFGSVRLVKGILLYRIKISTMELRTHQNRMGDLIHLLVYMAQRY